MEERDGERRKEKKEKELNTLRKKEIWEKVKQIVKERKRKLIYDRKNKDEERERELETYVVGML